MYRVFGTYTLAEDPRRVGAPLRKPFEGQWRARRGEYRVRDRIDGETRTVYVLDVDHRGPAVGDLDAALAPEKIAGPRYSAPQMAMIDR